MPPVARMGVDSPHSQRRIAIVAVLVIAVALAALYGWVWYPTTLQPDVTLTYTPFVASPCVALIGGGYGNTFNTTLTLVNSGRADGEASVQFLLGTFSLGYRSYAVLRGSPVTDVASIVGQVYSSPAMCGPIDNSEVPALALASVSRLPPIDQQALIYATVNPIATLGFVGGMLGGLSLLARRRGISLWRDLKSEAWGVAILTVFAAEWFGGLVSSVLMFQYNSPPDWSPIFLYGTLLGAVCVVTMIVAWRAVLRASSRNPPGPT